jgi:hypothetical protein
MIPLHYVNTERPVSGEWPALSLEKVLDKSGHNTITIRQSGVKILNLGCPVLEVFSRAGLLV